LFKSSIIAPFFNNFIYPKKIPAHGNVPGSGFKLETYYSTGVPPLVITPDSVTTNTLVPVTPVLVGEAVAW